MRVRVHGRTLARRKPTAPPAEKPKAKTTIVKAPTLGIAMHSDSRAAWNPRPVPFQAPRCLSPHDTKSYAPQLVDTVSKAPLTANR